MLRIHLLIIAAIGSAVLCSGACLAEAVEAQDDAPAVAAPAVASTATAYPGLDDREAAQISQGELVFIGELIHQDAGPVGMSMPPMYTGKLTFKVTEVLRGPAKPGETIAIGYSLRQMDEPFFVAKGKAALVVTNRSREAWNVELVRASHDELVAVAKLAAALPVGWKVVEGKPVSPWARLDGQPWKATVELDWSGPVCAKTGRPALLVDPELGFEVKHVPPLKDIEWQNPDGDGEYTITLSNTTDQPKVVPALLSQDGKILWDASLVLMVDGSVYPSPKFVPVEGKVQATILEPGQVVTHVVNVLGVQGPEWPRGGSRVDIRISLGQKAQSMSFYYFSRHHDPIRGRAVK